MSKGTRKNYAAGILISILVLLMLPLAFIASCVNTSRKRPPADVRNASETELFLEQLARNGQGFNYADDTDMEVGESFFKYYYRYQTNPDPSEDDYNNSKEFTDAWGIPLVFKLEGESVVYVASCGSNKVWDDASGDDIVVLWEDFRSEQNAE